MNNQKPKPRLAVVSPFLDKDHGTERIVSEWISHLADTFEIHVYSQQVKDINLDKITWHRIPKFPGPHLLNYLWWFGANQVVRNWHRRFRGMRADVVFSPGINCLDADVMSVHVVFAEYAQKVAEELRLSTHPASLWPQLLHRKFYYRFITFLERRLYRDQQKVLILIARRTADELSRHFARRGPYPVIYLGLEPTVFNPRRRASLRDQARRELGYSSGRFVLLLIGNHWSNKGLPVLLEALESLRDLPIDLLVVGREDPADYAPIVRTRHLNGRVQFMRPRPDVEFYYAAADAYAGPSLEDTFALPPAEAMACGLPVIASSANGTSEIISHGVDGLILQDPRDARTLASLIQKLFEEEPFRRQLTASALETASKYTWESNARELIAIFEEVRRKKSHAASVTLAEES